MSRSAVLVVTNERDVGADFVVRELDKRSVRVVRLNTERGLDWRMSLEPTAGWRVRRGHRALSSDQCAGVWWRRPEVPMPLSAVPAAGEAIASQWRTFLLALASVPGPTWVSDPARIRMAEDKALQLRRAREAGLSVPDTLWTTDGDEARRFVERWHGAAVVKSVTTAWWQATDGARFVYASLVGPSDLPADRRLAQTPIIFQQPVLPKRDVRVTVVEDVVLGAVRDSPSGLTDEPLDWRRASQRPWSTYELPRQVAQRCRGLVESLSLRFSGIDLAVDDCGNHWFLELNPNGEWGWLQRIGLPIAEALADTLSRPVEPKAR